MGMTEPTDVTAAPKPRKSLGDPIFTRSGSHPAIPPTADEVRHCLYTWLQKRLLMASIQLTPEWLERSASKGLLVFEQFVEIISGSASGEVEEDTLEKPVELSALP